MAQLGRLSPKVGMNGSDTMTRFSTLEAGPISSAFDNKIDQCTEKIFLYKTWDNVI